MTVVPEGHAAQSIDSEGQIRVFDDPGCLALHVHDHPADYQGARFFVQDYQTKDWVAAAQAILVRADEVPSPMNYGWHAFGDPTQAQAFALAHQGPLARGAEWLHQLATDLEGRRWRP